LRKLTRPRSARMAANSVSRNFAWGLLTVGICCRISLTMVIGHSSVECSVAHVYSTRNGLICTLSHSKIVRSIAPRQEEKTMTLLLKQAFEKASQLPEELQDQLAQEMLEDIAGELQWDTTLAQSEDLLEQLAAQALREFEAGRTRPQGFDEL